MSSVESVRLAQQAQIELLLHERSPDPLVRHEFEDRIRHRLDEARGLIDTHEEAEFVATAMQRLDAYASAPANDAATERDGLNRALEQLVAFNVAEARQAEGDAALWNRVGSVGGLAVAGLLLVASVALIVWLRRTTVVPMISLAETMERFESGQRDARAAERGPTEVREMSRHFNKLAAALCAQRRAQIAFLGGVAHDLRNPLGLLKLSLDVVDPDAPMPPEPLLRRILATIQRQVIHLERMVSDFLEIAKAENTELPLVLGIHDVRAIVREAVDLFAGALPYQQLRVSLPELATRVRCDALRIEQVVTNLISNAVKYSPRDTPVEVAVEADAEHVYVRVTDQGDGLSDDDKKSIFEPFQRAGISSHLVPGVGLGLSVVRRIVIAHGGRIEIDSAPGAGATFRVVLQRVAEYEASALPPKPSASLPP